MEVHHLLTQPTARSLENYPSIKVVRNTLLMDPRMDSTAWQTTGNL